MSGRLTLCAAFAVILTLAAASALAQPQDPRARGPYRGLFGGNELDPDAAQVLDFTASLFGGYDDDVTARGAESGRFGDRRAQAGSSIAGGSAAIRYARRVFQRVSFSSGADVSSSYYADLDGLVATSYGAHAGLSWTLSPRTTLTATQSFRFSPFFGYGIFPAAGVTDGPDVLDVGTDTRVVKQDNFSYLSSLLLNRTLSRRASVFASAWWSRTDFATSASSYVDWQRWSVGGGWIYKLTQNASARLGYQYQTGLADRRTTLRLDAHTIDAGIDYSRALSFSRRTRFSFGTGTAAYSRSRGGPVDDGEELHFAVVGNARLTHEIGRSWVAALNYDRGVRFVEGFNDAFLRDTVTASVGGYVGPRTRLSLISGALWGDYGISSAEANRRTRTMYASPSVQFAISRNLAVEAAYFYYRYRFDDGRVALPEGFIPAYARQGFRVTLSYWLPLLGAF